MKERSLDYENKFRRYLFSFDFETHKEICKNINVNHNQMQAIQQMIDDLSDIIDKNMNNPSVLDEANRLLVNIRRILE
jgi:hypothetical protein